MLSDLIVTEKVTTLEPRLLNSPLVVITVKEFASTWRLMHPTTELVEMLIKTFLLLFCFILLVAHWGIVLGGKDIVVDEIIFVTASNHTKCEWSFPKHLTAPI